MSNDLTILKPCPFCGRRASIHSQEFETQFSSLLRYEVICENTACIRYHITPDEAAAVWNKRSEYSAENNK